MSKIINISNIQIWALKSLTILIFTFFCSVAYSQLPSTLYAGHRNSELDNDKIDLVDTTGLTFTVSSTITVTSDSGAVQGIYGISQHPITKDIYILYEVGNGPTNRRLGVLNTVTNVISDIGNCGNLTDIVFTPDGTLYATTGTAIGTYEIRTVDIATAATTTFINPTISNWGPSIAYDASRDELIHFCYNGVTGINYNSVTQTSLGANTPNETHAAVKINEDSMWVISYNTLYVYDMQAGTFSGVPLNKDYHALAFVEAACVETISSFSDSGCDSYTVPSGDETYTVSGTYMDTIPNAIGCDSVMTITVTIGNNNVGTDLISACDSLIWIDGITYFSSTNTPTFTLTNTVGCDSVVTLDLTISSLDLTITNNSPTLIANNVNADSLQWVDCDNGNMPIAGETNATFVANSNGNYAVILYEDGCSGISSCEEVSNVGISENEKFDFDLYPNPNNGDFVLNVNSTEINSIEILDVIGKKLPFDMSHINSSQIRITLSNQISSIIFVKVITDNGELTKRVVIK